MLIGTRCMLIKHSTSPCPHALFHAEHFCQCLTYTKLETHKNELVAVLDSSLVSLWVELLNVDENRASLCVPTRIRII